MVVNLLKSIALATIIIAQSCFAEPMKEAKDDAVDIFEMDDHVFIVESHSPNGKVSVDIIKGTPVEMTNEMVKRSITSLKLKKKYDKKLKGIIVFVSIGKFQMKVQSDPYGSNGITRGNGYDINSIRKMIYKN